MLPRMTATPPPRVCRPAATKFWSMPIKAFAARQEPKWRPVDPGTAAGGVRVAATYRHKFGSRIAVVTACNVIGDVPVYTLEYPRTKRTARWAHDTFLAHWEPDSANL